MTCKRTRQRELFRGRLSIAIDLAVRHKLQSMRNTGWRIFGVVRNEQQLGVTFADQHINKTADQLAIQRIQPLQGFIED